ncbi:Bug family tripartite tricarboxylate transporter substrate binding protein [Cupriavidus basilensis]
MTTSRCIKLAAGILGGALVLTAFFAASAQAETPESYPSKPVRMIVPLPAGGATDSMARTLAERLSAATGQPFVVENRPGASGSIGADAVARAKPDGYTLMVSIGSVVSLVPYTTRVSYKPDAFLPITELARTPQVMYANPKIPAKDLASLVKWAKANPGKLSFASFSAGTQGHFAGVRLNQLAGIDMLHVAYKGSSPAMQDLMGGRFRLCLTPSFRP